MDPLNTLSASDRQNADLVLSKADYCTVAAIDQGGVYMLPISFGYKDGCLYIHSGRHGHKLEVFQDGTPVSVSIQHAVEVVPAPTPCKYTTHYISLLARGTIRQLDSPEQMNDGMNIIVEHYGARPIIYTPAELERVFVYQIEIGSLSIKQS